MNLLLSSNNAYLSPMKTMLTSFCETNRGENHQIYFLYGNVDENALASIGCFFEKHYDIKFNSIRIDESAFKQFPVSHHFSIETYYRFLATEILPLEEERVLWLDVDIIVKKSLYEFYYQSFDGKMLATCKSINKHPEVLLDRLGCPDGTVYFNAGVILFNLELIRKTYTVGDFFSYFASHKENITWLDQDILNGMFAQQTKINEYRLYNYQMFSEDSFSKSELAFIYSNTAIIHYVGQKKPWHSGYRNPCIIFWRQYNAVYEKKNNYISYYPRLFFKQMFRLKDLARVSLCKLRSLWIESHRNKTKKEY